MATFVQKYLMMRKVIGIGETVFDIIFDDENQPISGRPGGSVYNAMISLGRRGIASSFISEVGNDRIGLIIKQFLTDNGVDNSCVCMFDDGKSPLSLAFLDEHRNAQYLFYKDYPAQQLQFQMPDIERDDVLLFGSYFALNPVLRSHVRRLLDTARSRDAMIYYDVNFRATHRNEVQQLLPTIIENFRFADIVKGSDEDFEIIFATNDWRQVYHQFIEPYCKVFICTQGSKGASLLIENEEFMIDGKSIVPVSTVGAGDSFNAGTICGIIRNELLRSELQNPKDAIVKLLDSMRVGVDFASEVCMSLENYVQK